VLGVSKRRRLTELFVAEGLPEVHFRIPNRNLLTIQRPCTFLFTNHSIFAASVTTTQLKHGQPSLWSIPGCPLACEWTNIAYIIEKFQHDTTGGRDSESPEIRVTLS